MRHGEMVTEKSLHRSTRRASLRRHLSKGRMVREGPTFETLRGKHLAEETASVKALEQE